MPQTLGPYTPASTPAIAPGTAFPITIDRSAQAIQIHNDSPYRLYFQLDGQKPTDTTSMNGQYIGMAAPWAHPVLPVQRTAASGYERMLNAIKDFQGTLWVMVVDPTGALAQSGTVSLLVEIHVDVYLPGEAWPQSWAIPRQHDLTSQPRIVAMPPSGEITASGFWTPGGAPPQNLQLAFPAVPGIDTQGAMIYLYSFALFPASSSLGWALFTLRAQPADKFGSPIGPDIGFFHASLTVAATALAGQFTTTPVIFTPSAPYTMAIGFRPGASGVIINLGYNSGTLLSVHYNVNIGIAHSNVGNIPSIGNGGVAPLLPPAPGTINSTLW